MKIENRTRTIIKSIVVFVLTFILIDFVHVPLIKAIQSYFGVRQFDVRGFYVSPSSTWHLDNANIDGRLVIFGLLKTSKHLATYGYEDVSYFFVDSNKREVALTVFKMNAHVIKSNLLNDSIVKCMSIVRNGKSEKYKYHILPILSDGRRGYYFTDPNIIVFTVDDITFKSFFENYNFNQECEMQ